MLLGDLYGACANVKVTVGDVCDEHNLFIQEHSSYQDILGQPYITVVRMETKVLDDGSTYARVQSKDGNKAVQFLTICVNHARNKDSLRDHPLPRIQKEFQEDRKFNELPKWENQNVIGIQRCDVLKPDEAISGIFEEISDVDMMSELGEINQNRLQSGTYFVKVHSMEVYETLLQLKQSFEEMIEVQVETKYKTVAKKVKPVATPLLEGSNEVIEEASWQPILRNQKNIEHKFTEEH
ncbi:hypothetical protein L7F22_050720 [Adiantum nelumboides]|nr:hypothetical protein [Adiantum nelumboides]